MSLTTMRPERAPAPFANMSAPPRSTVVMPRLERRTTAEREAGHAGDAVAAARPDATPDAPPRAQPAIPVGPGGGAMVSNALCFACTDLPAALCARFGVGYQNPRLTAPLGLARALVAVARVMAKSAASCSRGAVRMELTRVITVPEGALVGELAERLASLPWPEWVPPVGFGVYLAMAPAAAALGEARAPATPVLACPLLAARLIAGLRGRVFMRDAPPTLSRLLDLWRGDEWSGNWEFWCPVRDGR
jgi:hypothetical protein